MPNRSWESFFMLWTAKEAVLKANGVGIGRFADCRLVTCNNTLTPEGVLHQSPELKRARQGANDLDDPTTTEAVSASMSLTFMDSPWQVSHYIHEQHVAAITCAEPGGEW